MLNTDDHHPRTSTGPARTTVGWRPAAAATALAAGPLLFLAAEAAAALAWDGPAYSYAADWISDLGVPVAGVFEGRTISSPLHAVLNAGLVAHGLLLLVGVALLATVLPAGTRARRRVALVAVAAFTAAGFAATGVFHTSTAAAQDGTLALHYTGAAAGVIGAGVLAVMTGLIWRRDPATRRLGAASTALGVLALAASAALALTMTAEVHHGLIERTAAYAGIAWQLLTAAHLLTRRAHLTTRQP